MEIPRFMPGPSSDESLDGDDNTSPNEEVTRSDLAFDSYVNIAGYKFIVLQDLDTWRIKLRQSATTLGLKGTILISVEGINIFVAGTRESIDHFIGGLKTYDEFSDLEFKESVSDYQPFNRMLVRIKNEIIAFGVDGIDPANRTSEKLSSSELKSWLEHGKDVTLLDVRNDYEIEVGTFNDAVTLEIDHFREFPKAVEGLPADLKEKPIVMFCTGGIRCEKAGPFMEQAGFKNVFQLDGGILKYFQEVGGDHYDGECFVFDKRVALDPDLNEAETKQCYACQAVLKKEDTDSDLYQPPSHCPKCYEPPQNKMLATIQTRQQAIRDVTNVLPGSIPYDNIRPIQVALKHDGFSLMEFLRDVFPQLETEHWTDSMTNGRFKVEDRIMSASDIVQVGERVNHHFPLTVEPDVNANIKILFEDEWLVVVDKPAPLPIHPSGRFNRNTLQHILSLVYTPFQMRPAHRIDAHTTGIVIFCKTKRVAGLLQPQFAQATVEKTYLALVKGHVTEDRLELTGDIGTEKTGKGGRSISADGQKSKTVCHVEQRLENDTTLLRVVPETGRTHQIRIHLAEAGYPILGDALYDPDLSGENISDLKLHAWKIKINHPITLKTIDFETEMPNFQDDAKIR